MSENPKGRILIVDDEDGLRVSMASILEMEGYEVQTAENGYIAIEKAKQTSFDIAFLDIKMPGLNGVETFLEIKKISPETTVVMMTAYAAEKLIRQALDEGAYACLSKPFDIEKAIESIENVKQKVIVLLVDDQKTDSQLIKDDLIAKGHKVITVSNGLDAVEFTKRKISDVVLLNILAVGPGGPETINRIKEISGERFPLVVIMSPQEVEDKVNDIIAAGAKKIVKLPVSLNIIEEIVGQISQEKIKQSPSH